MAFILFPWGQVGKKKAKPESFAYPRLGTLLPVEEQSTREILYCSYHIAPKDTLVLLNIHLLSTQTEESTQAS